jgi:hypothetical protein
VIIDLTPVRDRTGPARLLDMVAGRSKQAFKTWLTERDDSWRDGVEVVAMDGFVLTSVSGIILLGPCPETSGYLTYWRSRCRPRCAWMARLRARLTAMRTNA